DEEAGRRAQALDPLVDRAEIPVELFAAKRLDGHDRAVLDELGCRRGLDLGLQAEGAGELDGALADEGGAGVDRGPWMPLDEERRDSLGSQEQRGREPDEAPSDDDDWDIL